jgi:serine/threonine protein kinase
MDRLVKEQDGIYVVMDYGDEGDLFAMLTEKHRVSHRWRRSVQPRLGCTDAIDIIPGISLTNQYVGDNLLIKKVFLQILDGVEHLHELGIAHRDVKPENIVCSNDGTVVRIVDFGLATRDATSTEFGCGSTFYIAPECLGEWDNARCYTTQTADVWSLGVILVNLVCGRNPWRCASPTDESFNAFIADPTFLRRILPISHECLDILTQIFTPNPNDRISLDRLRVLVNDIVSFTEDVNRHKVARPVYQPISSPAPVTPPHAYVEEPYFEVDPASYEDPESFVYDNGYYANENDLPALQPHDSTSPLPQRSSSGSSEGPYPSTPRPDTFVNYAAPRISAKGSSITSYLPHFVHPSYNINFS